MPGIGTGTGIGRTDRIPKPTHLTYSHPLNPPPPPLSLPLPLFLSSPPGEPQLATAFFNMVRGWVVELRTLVHTTQEVNKASMNQVGSALYYCNALYCVLYCVLYCIVYCTVYCTVLCCAVYCTVLCIVLYYIVFYDTVTCCVLY